MELPLQYTKSPLNWGERVARKITANWNGACEDEEGTGRRKEGEFGRSSFMMSADR